VTAPDGGTPGVTCSQARAHAVQGLAPGASPTIGDDDRLIAPWIEQVGAEAVHWWLLATALDESLDPERLPEADRAVCRVYDARSVGRRMGGRGERDRVARALGVPAMALLDVARDAPAQVDAAVDGWDAPTALAVVSALVGGIYTLNNERLAAKRGAPVVEVALDALHHAATKLSLLGTPTEVYLRERNTRGLRKIGWTEERVEELLAERTTARATAAWSVADAVLTELREAGIEVMDGPDGTRWRIAASAV
jgi:cysteinyl-tRNA synthetase